MRDFIRWLMVEKGLLIFLPVVLLCTLIGSALLRRFVGRRNRRGSEQNSGCGQSRLRGKSGRVEKIPTKMYLKVGDEWIEYERSHGDTEVSDRGDREVLCPGHDEETGNV